MDRQDSQPHPTTPHWIAVFAASALLFAGCETVEHGRQVAAIAGVSLATVQNVEAATANPSLSTLHRLFGVLGLSMAVEPREADWDALVRFGLPLTALDPQAAHVDLSDVPGQIKQAALELTERRRGADRERKRDSLQGLLLALRSHFPRVYREWFGGVRVVNAFVPEHPVGRVIKLTRIARARISEVL